MCQRVLRIKKKSKYSLAIEKLRRDFLQSDEMIELLDLGAGSKSNKGNNRKVSTIAKYSLSSPHQCRMLERLVAYYKPNIILEIGTSLGISTSYLAHANKNALVYTLEGSENVLMLANDIFKKLNATNIQPILGDFDERLPLLLKDLDEVDFAFIDGNHTYKKTVDYFQQVLLKSNNETIIIIDDIYWSKDMTKAWEEIKANETTRTTIDLYYFGIVLLRKEMSKEHFTLRY